LLVEAAQDTVRSQPEWRSKFFHLALRRGRKIAKVAMARKPTVKWRSSSSACRRVLKDCLTLPTLLEIGILCQRSRRNPILTVRL